MVTDTIAAEPQGDPLDPATVFGASANHSQYKSVLEHLEAAEAEGARVTTGGESAQLDGEMQMGYLSSPPSLLTSPPTCEWLVKISSAPP